MNDRNPNFPLFNPPEANAAYPSMERLPTPEQRKVACIILNMRLMVFHVEQLLVRACGRTPAPSFDTDALAQVASTRPDDMWNASAFAEVYMMSRTILG